MDDGRDELWKKSGLRGEEALVEVRGRSSYGHSSFQHLAAGDDMVR